MPVRGERKRHADTAALCRWLQPSFNLALLAGKPLLRTAGYGHECHQSQAITNYITEYS